MKSSGVTQGSPENVDRSKKAKSLSDGLATCGSPTPPPMKIVIWGGGGSESAFLSFLSDQFHFAYM